MKIRDSKRIEGNRHVLVMDSNQHEKFLCGRDEGQMFSVPVGWQTTSVEEAIEWLRPDEVPSDADRQGDLFFVREYQEDKHFGDIPASVEARLNHDSPMRRNMALHTDTRGGSHHQLSFEHREDEQIARTSHRADEVLYVQKSGSVQNYSDGKGYQNQYEANPRVFVRGEVSHGEHQSTYYDEWVEVVPNRASGFGRTPLGRNGRSID